MKSISTRHARLKIGLQTGQEEMKYMPCVGTPKRPSQLNSLDRLFVRRCGITRHTLSLKYTHNREIQSRAQIGKEGLPIKSYQDHCKTHGHVLIQLGGKGSQKWMQHIASHFHNDIIRLLVGGLCDAEDSNILPVAVLLQPIN